MTPIADAENLDKLKNGGPYMSGFVTRTENIQFRFTITDIPLAKEASNQFGLTDSNLRVGDTMKYTYTFSIGYIGKIVENILYLKYLMNQGIVIDIDLSNTTDGRILIKELFAEYDRLYFALCEQHLPLADEWTEEDEITQASRSQAADQ